MHDWQRSRFQAHILRTGENQEGQEAVTIDHYDRGLEISLPEHGQFSVQHNGAPIWLEHHDGKFLLYVWADINQEDPTHSIDMSGALESKREILDGWDDEPEKKEAVE